MGEANVAAVKAAVGEDDRAAAEPEPEQAVDGEATGAISEPNGEQANEQSAEGEEESDTPHEAKPLPERCWFEVRGRRDAVADAKICLEAHMGYYPVYQE